MAHAVNVKIGTNLDRASIVVSSDRTIREILEDNEIQYATTTIYVDGATVQPGDMDKSLDGFGIQETCYIIAATKTSNAR